jgi:hypothetical protein
MRMHRGTWTLSVGSGLAAPLIAGVALLAPIAAHAAGATSYKMQPILKAGDTVNGFNTTDHPVSSSNPPPSVYAVV